MPAAYGFKATDPNDALAISNLMSQADSVNEKHYDTLAQYRINDVQLKPASLSLGLPRQWMLTMNTTMMGFNRPNNQSLYFRNDKDPVGDGYVTYPLSKQEFSNMVQGGLYDNPQDYVKRLRNGLLNKQFYRKTKVNLTTATVLESRLAISAGDLRARQVKKREYMVGNDLNSYAAFGPKKDLQSNLQQVLGQQTQQLVQNPVQRREPTETKTLVQEKQPLPELPSVQLNSEVDMKIDKARLDRLRSLDHMSQAPASVENTSETKPTVSSATVEPAPSNEYAVSSNADQNDQGDPKPRSQSETATDSSVNRFGVETDQDSSASSATQRRNRVSQETSMENAASPVVAQGDQTGQPRPKQDDNGVDMSFDPNTNLDDMMAQLTGDDDSQTTNRRRRRQRAYVDDFGQALQDSKASQQANLNKRRNLQRQHDAVEHQGPDL